MQNNVLLTLHSMYICMICPYYWIGPVLLGPTESATERN